MQNLFNKDPYFEIVDRLMKLTPDSKALWGKMDVAQMLAHCTEAFRIPLSNKKMSRNFIGLLFGPIAKKSLLSQKPYKHSLPTASNFKIKDERDFYIEKQNLMTMMAKFYSGGPNYLGNLVHPFFGKLSGEEWGIAMHKHLDHHFKQFGV
ncbi:MAG: DUF1569 domain-containing protein [Chitinophagaceae bacterium]